MTQRVARAANPPPETFEVLRQRIRDRFPVLSPHLKRIARASLEEPNGFALNTTPVIAAELGIQPSTLIRFAKDFGYAGFSDLQRVFRQRLIEGQANLRRKVLEREETAPPPDTGALLDVTVAANQDAIRRFREECDIEAVNRAIGILRPARHIYLAGQRRSRPIADYIQYGLIRGERACTMLDFPGGMAGPQITTIRPDDVLLAIAFPPYSQLVVDIVLDAHVSGRRIVALTDSHASPLAEYSEVALYLGTETTSQFQPISGAIVLAQVLISSVIRR